MAIPDYQTIMLPLLRVAQDDQVHRVRDAIEELSTHFHLTDTERSELLPSGTAPLFDNRVGWARTYLKSAGLIRSDRRGTFQITERGKALLTKNPDHIDLPLLNQYQEFREFRARRYEKTDEDLGTPDMPSLLTPEDSMASAFEKLKSDLQVELLEQVKNASPAFFERLVVELLVAMGYGGSRKDAGRAIGRSGDGGIDGIINEDKLGLDVVYVQAKRWDTTVGRPEIQKFAGALQGRRATKGVFITTSGFTRDAVEYAEIISSKIVLIDGDRLTSLMADHNVGVVPVGTYEVKKVDADYFEGG